jgi:hypothetical protein
VLGGGVGAAFAPTLLQAADDAGVYDVIRQNAAQQAARSHVVRQSSELPQFRVRLTRGRPDVVRAMLHVRLSPTHRAAKHGSHTGAEDVHCAACNQQEWSSPLEAILNDITLRAGDAVVMRTGAKVFRGAKNIPYNLADFMDFRDSTMLTKKERHEIDSALGLTQTAETLRVFESKVHGKRASLKQGSAQGVLTPLPVSSTAVRMVH